MAPWSLFARRRFLAALALAKAFVRATEKAERAIEAKPSSDGNQADASRYLSEGVRAYRKGRASFEGEPLMRAKKLLARAIELQPSPSAYFYMGSTLNLLGRPRTAIRAYLACLRYDTAVASVHQNIAALFDEIENRSAAVTHYRLWAKLEPQSGVARHSLATSLLWVGKLDEGVQKCDEAVRLDPDDPTIAFNCAQMLVLFAPPESPLLEEEDSLAIADESSLHFLNRIEPHFKRAQAAAFRKWRGGLEPAFGHDGVVQWDPAKSHSCPNGANVIRIWKDHPDVVVEDLNIGGDVYGQRVPVTFGASGFTWAGQRYIERTVHIARLRDVVVSGNEGIISRGCDVFVPYYDVQIPWHENLPTKTMPKTTVRYLTAAVWLLVLFPANYFSFLVDELARLTVWLAMRSERLPLLVPADRGKLKPFMYDWLSLLGGFDVIPYNVRPHFTGAEHVAEPRFVVHDLYVVDWREPLGTAKRADAFLLPPRWALLRLRGLITTSVYGTGPVSAAAEKLTPFVRVPTDNSTRTLLWIQRALATTRRVANEEELLSALRVRLAAQPGPPWTIKIFSDSPSVPTARETVQLFQAADIVLGVHGSGQANQIFCRSGTGIIDINLPEPHSQYTAHNSYALGLRYRLVMLRGASLHQALNLTLPVRDILDALGSLLRQE